MKMTIKQYKACVNRLNPALECSGEYWPYPQDRQSYYQVRNPENGKVVRLNVINTDLPGALIRIADGEPTPSEAVKRVIMA